MLTIGLTGGIGSGKTTVMNLFAQLGVYVVDADEVAKTLLDDPTNSQHVINHFGAPVMDAEQKLDRRKLRALIFQDKSSRTWLEALLHPLILQQIQHGIRNSDARYSIMAVPLLIEAGLKSQVDRVLVVDCSPVTQVARAVQRDKLSQEAIEQTLNAQADRQTRLAAADDVLHNESSLQQLAGSVQALHTKYLSLAKEEHNKTEKTYGNSE